MWMRAGKRLKHRWCVLQGSRLLALSLPFSIPSPRGHLPSVSLPPSHLSARVSVHTLSLSFSLSFFLVDFAFSFSAFYFPLCQNQPTLAIANHFQKWGVRVAFSLRAFYSPPLRWTHPPLP